MPLGRGVVSSWGGRTGGAVLGAGADSVKSRPGSRTGRIGSHSHPAPRPLPAAGALKASVECAARRVVTKPSTRRPGGRRCADRENAVAPARPIRDRRAGRPGRRGGRTPRCNSPGISRGRPQHAQHHAGQHHSLGVHADDCGWQPGRLGTARDQNGLGSAIAGFGQYVRPELGLLHHVQPQAPAMLRISGYSSTVTSQALSATLDGGSRTDAGPKAPMRSRITAT